jgi:hypothetical protein
MSRHLTDHRWNDFAPEELLVSLAHKLIQLGVQLSRNDRSSRVKSQAIAMSMTFSLMDIWLQLQKKVRKNDTQI